jgi:O-antigen/teichoic acid export membrane protein
MASRRRVPGGVLALRPPETCPYSRPSMPKSPLSRIRADLRSVIQVARLRSFDTSTPEGRSGERYRRIMLSTVASIAGTAVMTIVGLIAIPITIGFLGKEQYGLWVAVNSLVPWVSLFDMGLVAGLVIALSEAHGRDDHAAARGYYSTAFFTLLGVSAALLTALALLLPWVGWAELFGVPSAIPASTTRAGVTVALGFALLMLPLATVPQACAAYQQSYGWTAVTALAALLSLAFLVAATRLNLAFAIVVGTAGCAGFLAALAGAAYFLGRRFPWLRPSLSQVSLRSLRRLLASAVPLYVLQIGGLLVNQSQRPLLSNRAGLATVAEYDLLMRLFVMTTTVITVGTASFIPAFRESHERGDVAWMQRTFWRLVAIRLGLAVLLCVAFLLLGNPLLRIWLGRADFRFDLWVWLTLCALVMVSAWVSSFLELMTILDRIWPLVRVVFLQGLLTVGLTWVLAPHGGVLGAVISIALPALVVSGLMLPAMGWRLLTTDTRTRP